MVVGKTQVENQGNVVQGSKKESSEPWFMVKYFQI